MKLGCASPAVWLHTACCWRLTAFHPPWLVRSGGSSILKLWHAWATCALSGGFSIAAQCAHVRFCTLVISPHCHAGALFWKWGLSPRNPRDDFLQVAAPDPTFTEIVVPSAKAALEYAKAASPLQACQKARPDRPHACIHAPPRPSPAPSCLHR
jgi:hypothetical protein